MFSTISQRYERLKNQHDYAGFWRRTVADGIDPLVIAKAITLAASAWLQETLAEHPRIHTALADVGLWPVS